MMYRYLVFILVLFGSQVFAEPLSLSVTEISKDLAAETVDIKVIELHESVEEKSNTVTYTGIPLNVLLQYLYPKQWKTFEGGIYKYKNNHYKIISEQKKIMNNRLENNGFIFKPMSIRNLLNVPEKKSIFFAPLI